MKFNRLFLIKNKYLINIYIYCKIINYNYATYLNNKNKQIIVYINIYKNS